VPDDLFQILGRRARDLRLARGLSQEALAEKANLHRNYVGRIERGEPGVSLFVVAQLAAALDVTLAEFFAPFSKRFNRTGF
jgi:transcriptional regulator with XRE-family HTH domain